jgi:hypothetical protein
MYANIVRITSENLGVPACEVIMILLARVGYFETMASILETLIYLQKTQAKDGDEESQRKFVRALLNQHALRGVPKLEFTAEIAKAYQMAIEAHLPELAKKIMERWELISMQMIETLDTPVQLQSFLSSTFEDGKAREVLEKKWDRLSEEAVKAASLPDEITKAHQESRAFSDAWKTAVAKFADTLLRE